MGFEVWNEPDAWAFWGRGVLPVDPVAYTQVLERAYDAVKSVTPWIPVIGGALAGYSSTVPGVHMSVNQFVGEMLQAGAANYMDGISVHLYTGGPTPPAPADYEPPVLWLRSTLSQYGTQMPIWVTESGVSTTGPSAVSETGQAQSLVRLYRWFQSQPDVKAIFIHSLFERWTDPSSAEVGFGLIHQGSQLEPKPAFAALQQAVGGRATTGPQIDITSEPSPGTEPPSQQLRFEGSIPADQSALRNRRLLVNVTCRSTCEVKARGILSAPVQGAKPIIYRLSPTEWSAATGAHATLALRLRRSKSQPSLGRGDHFRDLVQARVSLVARSNAGLTMNRTLQAKLRR